MTVLLSNLNRLKKFIGRFLDKFAVKWILKIPPHLARLANTLLKDEESERDSHVLARNFAKYLPILKLFSLTDSAINLS